MWISSALRKLHICGCGGIGRRIRFRILRHSVCRFKSCHPHQQERAPKGALSCWFGRRGGEAPPLVDFILFVRSENAAGKNAVFCLQNADGVGKVFFKRLRLAAESGASPVTRTSRQCRHPKLGWRQQKSEPYHTTVGFGFIITHCTKKIKGMLGIPLIFLMI